MHFDIVHAADPRFFGGIAPAVRLELEAAIRFGLTSALIPFVGARHVRVRRFDKRTAETIENLNIALLTGEEPVECDRSSRAAPIRLPANACNSNPGSREARGLCGSASAFRWLLDAGVRFRRRWNETWNACSELRLFLRP